MKYDKKEGDQHFWLAVAGVLAPSILLGGLVLMNWMIYKQMYLQQCGGW